MSLSDLRIVDDDQKGEEEEVRDGDDGDSDDEENGDEGLPTDMATTAITLLLAILEGTTLVTLTMFLPWSITSYS